MIFRREKFYLTVQLYRMDDSFFILIAILAAFASVLLSIAVLYFICTMLFVQFYVYIIFVERTGTVIPRSDKLKYSIVC